MHSTYYIDGMFCPVCCRYSTMDVEILTVSYNHHLDLMCGNGHVLTTLDTMTQLSKWKVEHSEDIRCSCGGQIGLFLNGTGLFNYSCSKCSKYYSETTIRQLEFNQLAELSDGQWALIDWLRG